MASSKNARKITLPSFSNTLSFASGDFYGGSTTLSTSFNNHKSSFLGYKMVNPCSGGSESELMPGQKHKGGLGVLPQVNFYNWSSKTYSFGNFWEEIIIASY